MATFLREGIVEGVSYFDQYPNCCVCNKVCYSAEQILIGDSVYHFNDECWSCGVTGTQGCGKRLERLGATYALQLGIPYCLVCFDVLFLEGYGTKANVLERFGSNVDDAEEDKPDVQEEIGAHSSAVFRLSAPVEDESVSSSANLLSGCSLSPPPESVSPKSKVASQITGFNPKCPKCSKSVYKMEEIVHNQESYHKTCFCCGGNNTDGCGRVIAHGDFNTHGAVAYCNACFTRLFTQGASIGAVLSPSTKKEPLEGASSSVPPKFANLGGGGGEKCPACSKMVYKMEEVMFEGTKWHKLCFACGGGASDLGCKRVLAHSEYKAQAGVAFCNACFAKHFMKAGARGAVLITSSGAIESQSNKDESSSGLTISERSALFHMREDPSTSSSSTARRPSTSEKFANLGGGGGEKCPACSKMVYKMEEVMFEGTKWHKLCFACGGGASDLGCKRVLAHGEYKAQAGVAFCNACFAKHFMKAGARGAVLITSSGAIESRTNS